MKRLLYVLLVIHLTIYAQDTEKKYTQEEIEALRSSAKEIERKHQEKIDKGELDKSAFGTYSSQYGRPPIDWDTYEDGKYNEVAEAEKWDNYVVPPNANQRLEDYKNKKLFNLIILLAIITVMVVAGYFMFFRKKNTETTYKKRSSDLQSLKQNIDEVHNALFNSDEGNKALIEMANKGDYQAQYNLGTFYFKNQEFEKAKYWFEQSAINGDKDSQYQMGNLYLQGTGVKKDLNMAFSWYEKASKQEHSQSQHNLGLFYMQGEIVERNKEKALHWFKKAAENGYEPSKQIISTFG